MCTCILVSLFGLDPLIERLAAEFKRLGMPKRLAKLRAFYGARKQAGGLLAP